MKFSYLQLLILVNFITLPNCLAQFSDPRFTEIIDPEISEEFQASKRGPRPPITPYFTDDGEEFVGTSMKGDERDEMLDWINNMKIKNQLEEDEEEDDEAEQEEEKKVDPREINPESPYHIPVLHDDTDELAEDLLGESVQVKTRQLGKSIQQVGPDGLDIGFKGQGAFVPWKRADDESSTQEPVTDAPTPPPKDEAAALNRLMPKFAVRASSLFSNCGKPGGRTCFAYPDGCIETRKCLVAAAIFEEDTDPQWMKITMAASAPHGFVAIAFSEDRFMGNDIVVYCNHIPSGPQMTLHLAMNKGYENVMQKDHNRFKSTLSSLAGFVQSNSVIACEFDMSTQVYMDNSTSKEIDMLSSSYHVFLAFGRYDDKLSLNNTDFGTLTYHHMAIVSKEKIKLKDIFKSPKMLHPRGREYILIHIIPYILAFSFFIPSAIFMSKYGREAFGYPVTKRLIPFWLLIHVIFLVIAIVLSIIGLISIIIELGGVWRSISGKAIFHSVFGIFATALNIINALFGFFGLGLKGEYIPETSRRVKYIKWMHWYFGNCVFIFGMCCLFVAPYMYRAHAPCLFQYLVAFQIFVYVLTEIFMSLHSYWMVKKFDGKHMYRRVFPGPMIPWNKNDMKEWAKVDKFDEMDIWYGRKRAVFFYIITAAIFCIGLIGLMFLPTVLCRRGV